MKRGSKLGIYARNIIHILIVSSINSSDGIKFSLDILLNNPKLLNILSPVALRQYYCNDIDVIWKSEKCVRHYTYGFGSSTSSIGIDPLNFVKRKTTPEI